MPRLAIISSKTVFYYSRNKNLEMLIRDFPRDTNLEEFIPRNSFEFSRTPIRSLMMFFDAPRYNLNEIMQIYLKLVILRKGIFILKINARNTDEYRNISLKILTMKQTIGYQKIGDRHLSEFSRRWCLFGLLKFYANKCI